MTNDKVVRMPITFNQRKRNEFGKGYVPCEISERWLKFPSEVSDLKYMLVDVMTMGSNDEPRKICELVLNKDDILRALESIEVK